MSRGAPKSVLKNHHYADILCSYRLNGRKWEFNAEYSRAFLASLNKGLIFSREARKCAGEDKAYLRFMRRKWDLTVRSDEWAWYFAERRFAEIAHIKRVSTVGRKNDAHWQGKKDTFPLLFSLFSLLISYHCTTVACSTERLPLLSVKMSIFAVR